METKQKTESERLRMESGETAPRPGLGMGRQGGSGGEEGETTGLARRIKKESNGRKKRDKGEPCGTTGGLPLLADQSIGKYRHRGESRRRAGRGCRRWAGRRELRRARLKRERERERVRSEGDGEGDIVSGKTGEGYGWMHKGWHYLRKGKPSGVEEGGR